MELPRVYLCLFCTYLCLYVRDQTKIPQHSAAEQSLQSYVRAKRDCLYVPLNAFRIFSFFPVKPTTFPEFRLLQS